MIEGLEVTSEFVSDHVSNYLSLNGKMPAAKAQMLELIDKFLCAPADMRVRYLQPEELRHP